MKVLQIFGCLILFNLMAFAQRTFVSRDIFGSRAFVENKGQFNSSINSSEEIKFAYESSGEHIYFTNKGLVYKLIKQVSFSEEEIERIEKGKQTKIKSPEVYYVNMNWLNANDNIQIEESEKTSYYFTSGAADLNAYAFKKITYKNVYDKIDIEYTIPGDKANGIKYSVILHPGANLNAIKIAYTGAIDKIIEKNNDIIIQTPLEDITEHAPFSFYEDKQELVSEFTLENKIISFHFPNGYQNNKTLIIDPWVAVPAPLTTNSCGYDVDYDYSGSLYVYGGSALPGDELKVAKYSPAGALVWVFSGVLPLVPWNSNGGLQVEAGNFVVNKTNNKTYVGSPLEINGTRIIRLDANGNYDNFVSTPIANWRELWDMGFHCGSGKVYGLGGGTNGNISAGLIDQITGAVTPANFTGLPYTDQDVVSNAIDDNGNIFILFGSGNTLITDRLLRVNPGFNGNIWFAPTTYTVFYELGNKAQYVAANIQGTGYNSLAVNNSFLFMYDGFNLAAYDKNTGVKIGFTTIAGQTSLQQGGIAVDDCNNIYIGSIGNIKCYNFDGVNFNALASLPLGVGTPNQYVYDIKLDKNTNLLYFSGNSFIGTKIANQSLACLASTQFTFNSNCVGNNNGTAVATLTTSIVNPLINYIWTGAGGTVSATYSTGATSNTVNNLPNGTYTIQMQINAPCGPVYVNTININCCTPFSVVPTVTQAGCTSTNSVSIAITGSTLVPAITWSPAPGAIAGNSLSASGLPVGITTISASFGGGCAVVVTVNIVPPPPVTFTINNLAGSNSITCLNPTINLQSVSSYTGAISYTWSSPSFTANTSTVAITAPNTLTLTGIDPATGCQFQQTVAIGIFTTQPTNSVSPVSQVVTCNSSPITFTGTSANPTVNVQNDWYSPLNPLPGGVPIATSNNTISLLSGVLPPGVYTLQTTNLVNGCKAYKTVTVTSLDAWPTFGISSSTNYSVGCSPLNQTTLSITNPVSTQTPPAVCSFTFLPPGFAGTLAPGPYTGNTSTTTTIPGTWTVVVNDNSNNCHVTLAVPIIQNTVAPNVTASITSGQMLSCYHPTLFAIGLSTTPNTQINWNQPQAPSLVASSTIIIGPGSGPNTSTTSLTYANYTVIATNTLNACLSTSIVSITQNFKPPVSSPMISIGTPTAIYCTVAHNPVVLTTGSSTTTSGGGPLAFPVPLLWEGPSPQGTVTGASSYSCYFAGIYSLTIMDNYNGCTRTSTINVVDKTQPPVITNTAAASTLDCGSNEANLSVIITGSPAELMYWFFQYPAGAAFTPTAAPISNGSNPFLSGTFSSSVGVSMSGIYQYMVTNTLTGCRVMGTFNVSDGDLTADFIPDPIEGYAPLLVAFTNNSSSSLGSTSITSIWSFGNGTSQTTTSNINTIATYDAPGTYTVMLLTSKGTCIDTAYKIIKADIPSKLEIPNIFTPNGDGSNDVFFLKTTELGEINAFIYDRWGVKVYEVQSSTGNIAWDGKNLQGKDCADGIYFYVISAKGNDSKEYKLKGNVSLFR